MKHNVVTITVNQWVIAANAKTGANDPALCVNMYVDKDGVDFGERVGETSHVHEMPLPADAKDIRVIYDPINKTPCGASCWMEYTL